MILETTSSWKLFNADFSFIGFYSSMGVHVQSKVLPSQERYFSEFACILPPSKMHKLVCSKIISSLQAFITHFTLERLLSCVLHM